MKKLFFLLVLHTILGCHSETPTEKHLSHRNNIENVHDKIVAIQINEPYITFLIKIPFNTLPILPPKDVDHTSL